MEYHCIHQNGQTVFGVTEVSRTRSWTRCTQMIAVDAACMSPWLAMWTLTELVTVALDYLPTTSARVDLYLEVKRPSTCLRSVDESIWVLRFQLSPRQTAAGRPLYPVIRPATFRCPPGTACCHHSLKPARKQARWPGVHRRSSASLTIFMVGDSLEVCQVDRVG